MIVQIVICAIWSALLTIPMLNLLIIGPISGLIILFGLRKGMQIPLGLLLAGIWALLAIWQLLARENDSMPARSIFVFLYSFGFTFWFYSVTDGVDRKRVGAFEEKHAGEFTEKNSFGTRTSKFYFNDKTCRFALVDSKGEELFAFDFVKSFQLTWVETSKSTGISYSNCKIQLVVNDIANPIRTVFFDSKSSADVANAQLGLLLH